METTASIDVASVAAVVDGDSREFTKLFERHVGTVRGVIAKNVRDPDDMADCVQEVFARAFEDLHKLREPARFRAWLLSIARHVSVDRRRRRVNDTGHSSDQESDELPTAMPSPGSQFELAELGRTVRGSLAALSPRDATAVAMATYLDFGPAEIAAALGVSNGNAKVIVHRARRRLRDALVLELRANGGLGCAELREIDVDTDRQRAVAHVAECDGCQRQAQELLQPS